MSQKLLLLAAAGAAGTLARYALSEGVYRLVGREFPWGTATVNLVGCALFGLVWGLSVERGLLGDQTRVVLLAGFMGSFTTFSSLIFDSEVLLLQGRFLPLAINLAGQNLLGFAALYAGRLLARLA